MKICTKIMLELIVSYQYFMHHKGNYLLEIYCVSIGVFGPWTTNFFIHFYGNGRASKKIFGIPLKWESKGFFLNWIGKITLQLLLQVKLQIVCWPSARNCCICQLYVVWILFHNYVIIRFLAVAPTDLHVPTSVYLHVVTITIASLWTL